MKKPARNRRLLLLTALLLTMLLPQGARAQETIPSIVVMADNVLATAMAHVARSYAREKHEAVALSFADTPEISEQVQGANADVLITARGSWLEQLKLQGLIDVYSETQVAKDRLALVAPPQSQLQISLKKKFPTGKLLLEMGQDRLFVIANPQYLPEGVMAREAMRQMNADIDLEPYTAYLDDRNEMYQLIRDYRAYGLLLSSIAYDRDFKVLDLVPERYHSPIIYRAVVLAGNNMDAARRFMNFLTSRNAREIFKQYGLQVN